MNANKPFKETVSLLAAMAPNAFGDRRSARRSGFDRQKNASMKNHGVTMI